MDELNPNLNESENETYSLEDLLDLSESITSDLKEIRKLFLEYVQKRRKPVEPEWLNSYDTMQKLQICKKTLQRYRDNGIIRFTVFNGNVRFRYLDVIAMLNCIDSAEKD